MKKRALVRVGLILFLALFPHLAPLPFYSYTLVGLLVIFAFQRSNGETLADLGLWKQGITSHVFIVGGGSALAWLAFNQLIYIPFIFKFFTVPEYTEYDFIQNNPANLVIILLAAWAVGGFYEEIVFRGFILNSIQVLLGTRSASFLIAAILSSVLFALYHMQQGIFGIIASFGGSLLWSYLYYRYHRNLWYSIVSHALYDTLLLILIYFRLFGVVRW